MKKNTIFKAIVSVLIVAAAVAFLPCIKVVAIEDRNDLRFGFTKKNSGNIYSRKALDGFAISYTHSVNKGRVHDWYECVSSPWKSWFVLKKSVFVSYGAGIPEPYEIQGCSFEITDTGYVIDGLNRELGPFLLAVGVVAEHSVTIGKDEYFLKDFFPAQTSLLFRIRRISVLKYIKRAF